MPCIDCAKLIHQSGIKKVYYKEDYKANVGYGRPFLEKCKIELEQI
jgi:dCMP deaminase